MDVTVAHARERFGHHAATAACSDVSEPGSGACRIGLARGDQDPDRGLLGTRALGGTNECPALGRAAVRLGLAKSLTR